jgi:hypothetical protein
MQTSIDLLIGAQDGFLYSFDRVYLKAKLQAPRDTKARLVEKKE